MDTHTCRHTHTPQQNHGQDARDLQQRKLAGLAHRTPLHNWSLTDWAAETQHYRYEPLC